MTNICPICERPLFADKYVAHLAIAHGIRETNK